MNEKHFELAMPLAVAFGAVVIAAAIYLKPSEFDRCVDRNIKVVQQSAGDFSAKSKNAIAYTVIGKCGN